MKEIRLAGGEVAFVSDEDFDRVAPYKWFRTSHGYARTDIKHKTVYMHRFLLGVVGRISVDHGDGNGLNNTRENIRICTTRQNQQNRRPRRVTLSRFKGVAFRGTWRWAANIKLPTGIVSLGTYRTAEAAARAYDRAAREYFGEFARLNFPDQPDTERQSQETPR